MNMNKKYILSLLACAAFTACDMDLTPETSISTGESVQSVLDCQKYSNLIHGEWRGYIQGTYDMDALVQSGLITATADYGNTYGAFYRWDYTISDGAFSGCWADNYNYIANANVLLKGGQALLDANTLSDSERAQVSLYMGHASFLVNTFYQVFLSKIWDIAVAMSHIFYLSNALSICCFCPFKSFCFS